MPEDVICRADHKSEGPPGNTTDITFGRGTGALQVQIYNTRQLRDRGEGLVFTSESRALINPSNLRKRSFKPS